MILASSIPFISNIASQYLLQYNAISPSDLPGRAQAIVLLTSGLNKSAPEYGRDVASSSSLHRARYAAFLHRTTGLPIMVVGGKPVPSEISEAEAVEQLLENEFSVPVRWTETTAKGTATSAQNSFYILRDQGIKNIFLVTHGFHMKRAVQNFSVTGFNVIAAPTGLVATEQLTYRDFLPSASALSSTARSLNEYFGLVWHSLKTLI